MSFIDAYDGRFSETFFDVHAWPGQGRIVMINKPNYESTPLVTELHVNSGDRSTTTIVTALALASAGDPPGRYFEHDIYGGITELYLSGAFKETVKRL